VGGDEGIGCETMRCDADEVRYNARMSAKKDRAVTTRVLPNLLAREEEEPLERQLDLHFDLLFNTVDYAPLETFLRPDRWYHAGVCENIVIRPCTC